MPRRERSTVIQNVAALVWLPCLAGAFVFYNFVTYVPEAYPMRDRLSGSLLVAGLGAAGASLAHDSSRVRAAAAVLMVLGLAGVIASVRW